MTDQTPFLNRIEAIKAARADSGNFSQRDICLSRFEAVWKPLIDHVQNLADRHLPTDKRLRVVFEVNENMRVDLKFFVDHDLNANQQDSRFQWNEKDRWREMQSLKFYKSAAHGPILNLLTGRLKLRDIFSRNALNDYALTGLELWEKDTRLKHATLHPARMDQAKDLIEYWLARQMAFDFDRDRLNPRSILQVTIKHMDSGPESHP
ncbi:MAG: hypothetical protein ACXW30_03555 [Micavibrio sp.]